VRLAFPAAATVLVILALPGAASATFIPGPNGKIAFASGRGGAANDSDARIWVADYPSGTPVQVTTLPAGVQHRHPNWSPDHTRIVYAAGTAFGGAYELWIVDLRTGSQTSFVTPAVAGQDRPSWSPDGTRIAYGSGGKIYVKGVAPGSIAQMVTNGTTDERPVWSPDGNTLYFNRGPKYSGTPSTGDKNIFSKSPVTAAGAVNAVVGGADIDDWQPALSPDAKRLCFLRGPQSDGADLWTVDVATHVASPFATEAGAGELNCVWAPDGTRVLYTHGAFGGGDLWTRDADGGDPTILTAFNVDAHFDGNADWATNFSPTCDNKAASVAHNSFIAIALSCTDPDAGFGAAPPAPEALGSSALEIVTPPAHGNVGAITGGKVIYTPAKDFAGTDSFTYRGNDDVSDSAPAKVTIQVAGAGGGGGGGADDRTAPAVSQITLSRKRWRRGNALPATVARTKVGTTIAFGLDEAGTATISFVRVRSGRRVGGKCVKPTRANRSRKHCTRFAAAGSFAAAAKLGANRVRFQGRLDSAHRLGLGTYRLSVSAQDAAGNTSQPRTGPRFTIVRR
jgi:hypothetical protein